MGLKIQFNLRFMLLAVVPYFAVLGLVPAIVELLITDESMQRGTPSFEDVSWRVYLKRLALVTYTLSLCYWLTVLYACVYIRPLRRWITNESDADRPE
ncbi:hypothetical protein [Lacipirellula sp.]|uniref:hypothetical protein n=1 Tax=Lacipirellula sp. TaxID=2691419 RepID=UPI003D0F7006